MYWRGFVKRRQVILSKNLLHCSPTRQVCENGRVCVYIYIYIYIYIYVEGTHWVYFVGYSVQMGDGKQMEGYDIL